MLAWIAPRGIVAAAVSALFAITPEGQLEVFSAEAQLEPGPGWTVIALVDSEHRDAAGWGIAVA